MPTSLVKQVADYCWSHDFLSVFRKFFADHADAFNGNVDKNFLLYVIILLFCDYYYYYYYYLKGHQISVVVSIIWNTMLYFKSI